jgi:hypothetical protein
MHNFESAHAAFIQYHLNRREGERRGRLERGHAHAEKLFAENVWWPLKGYFEDLHPEYEVLDWRGRSYFADFCYSPKRWRILIEIKGFGEHVRNMDREKYCRELNREAFLSGIGYRILSFAYDDVAQRPDLCIQLLRIYLSQFESSRVPRDPAYFLELEILRLAVFLARPIRPIDVAKHFKMDYRTVMKRLNRLVEKGWLQPIVRGKGQRIFQYQLTKSGFEKGLVTG